MGVRKGSERNSMLALMFMTFAIKTSRLLRRVLY